MDFRKFLRFIFLKMVPENTVAGRLVERAVELQFDGGRNVELEFDGTKKAHEPVVCFF